MSTRRNTKVINSSLYVAIKLVYHINMIKICINLLSLLIICKLLMSYKNNSDSSCLPIIIGKN